MSLDKAIKHKKERRKPYYGGNCDWCRENRLHKSIIQQDVMDSKLNEYEKGGIDNEITNCN